MNNTGTNVERLYRERNPKGHWFDRDTLRFFKSRIGDQHAHPDGSWIFVSSERGPHSPRLYTIRFLSIDGQIGDVSAFQEYTRGTIRSAFKRAIQAI